VFFDELRTSEQIVTSGFRTTGKVIQPGKSLTAEFPVFVSH
jgi:hypothetical protein